MRISKEYIKKIANTAHNAVQRGLDRKVKVAVTGFSGSGKTAFITALIRHLTAQATVDNLPFFDVVKSGRFIACKNTIQSSMVVPSFDYNKAVAKLLDETPTWPAATARINTLTLTLKYMAQDGLRAHFAPESTLTIELYDYPGEWLIDLPMLNMDFEAWSIQMLALYAKHSNHDWSDAFLQTLSEFDAGAMVNEQQLSALAKLHAALLRDLKSQTPAVILQPGRQILPGDLEGAPMLAFFPCSKPTEAGAQSNYEELVRRFEAYKDHVIKPFFKDYFCEFDRQVVLLDVLSALAGGKDYVDELQQATSQLVQLFDYGKNHWLSRFWAPKIDKVLFVANKCDLVSSHQHSNLVRLLDSLLHESHNELRFEHVKIDTMALSSVRSSLDRVVKEHGDVLQCIYGKPIGESNWITYLPPTVPSSLHAWPTEGFEFVGFHPLPAKEGKLEHVRLDHALQFLLGDKLR